MSRHTFGRLSLHAVCSRTFFYLPVMLLHLARSLEAAGYERSQGRALGILALFALGLTLSEFPSGVFADWAGRVRSLQVAAVLMGIGMLLYTGADRFWVMALAQLCIGIGAGFVSGSDTALLHHYLEQSGHAHEYGVRLAWLRFWNAVGLVTGAAVGGVLYVVWWPGVFVFSATAQVAGAVAVGGLAEPHRPGRSTSYWQVLAGALRRVRRDRALATLVVVASGGVAVFSFLGWLIQGQLRDAGRGPVWMGVAVAIWAVLVGVSQRVSAWAGQSSQRSAHVWPRLLLVAPAAVAAVAATHALGVPFLGTAVLVVVAAGFAVYRNATNVQVQMLVPDEHRASVVSLMGWTGSLWYLAIFPLFGWFVDRGGPVDGYLWIAWGIALAAIPLLALARWVGVWKGGVGSQVSGPGSQVGGPR